MTDQTSLVTGAMETTLFLCGDVMTGRGIDQVLPHPVEPQLYEQFVTTALDYLRIAEAANGPIPKPVGFDYIWGEALSALQRYRPDLRLINLETSITTHQSPWPKSVNYRMSPANVPCLTAAGIDCCSLANNHVMDWGRPGLADTLDTLRRAGIAVAGAGRNLSESERPSIMAIAGKGRVIVFSFGSTTSGIPRDWSAGPDRAGVNLLTDLSEQTIKRIAAQARAVKRNGDVLVASIHWGSNWGYDIPPEQIAFAHGLIDAAGIDVVHGHSSHHAKAIEVYQGKLVLYGCGDLLNDYEGIADFSEFRDDLALMYFATVNTSSGRLERLVAVPFQIRNFSLQRPKPADYDWLRDTLSREGARFGTRFDLTDDALTLVPA